MDNEEKDDTRRVITSSREDAVFIHDEDSADPHKSSRYKMKQHKKACNSLSIKEGTELVASASDDGGIIITNL